MFSLEHSTDLEERLEKIGEESLLVGGERSLQGSVFG